MTGHQYRRNALACVASQQSTHPGLWLDRYMPVYSDEELKKLAKHERKMLLEQEQKKQLMDAVTRLSAAGNVDPYKAFFHNRWKKALDDAGAQTRTGTVRTRMVVGLGSEGILETSIALHRTYGVPYIPGSALKGLLAAYVRKHATDSQWGVWVPKQQPNGDQSKDKTMWQPDLLYTFFFGTTDQAGYLTFYDALYVPGSGFTGTPLHADVMTVHHSDYYVGNKPPADSDSPIPVPFLSATGTYLLAIGMPNVNCDTEQQKVWINFAFDILAKALAEWGIGAKTSSGYGRLDVEVSPSEAATPLTEDERQTNDLIQQINDLPDARVASELNGYVNKWRTSQLPAHLSRKIAQALVDKVREAGREKNSSDKKWYKELIAYLKEVQ